MPINAKQRSTTPRLSTPARHPIIMSHKLPGVSVGPGMQRGSMADPVLVNDDGAVRVIRFNRPEKRNALTQPMYAAITRALLEAQTSEAIRCVVLTGGQGVYSAGADIGEVPESADRGAA